MKTINPFSNWKKSEAFVFLAAIACFITVCVLAAVLSSGCSMFSDGGGSGVSFTKVGFDKTSLKLSVGGSEYLNLKLEPASEQNKADIQWFY